MKYIALITGASSGIGREFVYAIDQSMDSIDEIWLVARRKDRLEEVYKSFIALRKSHPCFMNGKYETVLVNGNTYGYRRSDDTETVNVYMNNGEKALPLQLSGRIIISKNYKDEKLFENGYVVTTEE